MRPPTIRLITSIAAALVVAAAIFPYVTKTEAVITVTDKERVTVREGKSIGSKYLIFTESEVFENTDSLCYLKFSSSDLQGKLKVGETYRVLVYGWRIPFMSRYRNIVSIVSEQESRK